MVAYWNVDIKRNFPTAQNHYPGIPIAREANEVQIGKALGGWFYFEAPGINASTVSWNGCDACTQRVSSNGLRAHILKNRLKVSQWPVERVVDRIHN